MTSEVVVGGDCPEVRVVGELDANTVPGLEADRVGETRSADDRRKPAGIRGQLGDRAVGEVENLVGRLEIQDPPVAIRAGLVRLGLAHRLLPIAGGVSSSDRPAASDAPAASPLPRGCPSWTDSPTGVAPGAKCQRPARAAPIGSAEQS